jgi:uncharacterized protein involved in exopolysaccharide biosynthesis
MCVCLVRCAQTPLSVSLPAWLALALSAFLATFAGLFATCLVALLPTLREVTLSAQAVRAHARVRRAALLRASPQACSVLTR